MFILKQNVYEMYQVFEIRPIRAYIMLSHAVNELDGFLIFSVLDRVLLSYEERRCLNYVNLLCICRPPYCCLELYN